MSYEGYTQLLCSKGHLSSEDAWSEREECHCGSPIVWRNGVDQTNGEEAGFIYKEDLTVVSEQVTEKCPHCGNVKIITEVCYKIPTREETNNLRTYDYGTVIYSSTGLPVKHADKIHQVHPV